MSNLISAANAFRSTNIAHMALENCSTMIEYENKIMSAVSAAIRSLCYNTNDIELRRDNNMTKDEFAECRQIIKDKLEALGYNYVSVELRFKGEEYEERYYDDYYSGWDTRMAIQPFDAIYVSLNWRLDTDKVDCWADDSAKEQFKNDLVTTLAAQ